MKLMPCAECGQSAPAHTRDDIGTCEQFKRPFADDDHVWPFDASDGGQHRGADLCYELLVRVGLRAERVSLRDALAADARRVTR